MMHNLLSFPSIFGVDTSVNPKYITMVSYHFISMLLMSTGCQPIKSRQVPNLANARVSTVDRNISAHDFF